MLRLLLSLTLLCLLSSCSDSGGGSGGSADSAKDSSFQFDPINVDDVLLKVGGTCQRERYYRVLESEILKGPGAESAILQLHILEDHTYQMSIESFMVRQSGPDIKHLTDVSSVYFQGVWSEENGHLKLSQGILKLVSDPRVPGDAYHQLEGFQKYDKSKIIFRSLKEASDQGIPAKFACPDRALKLAPTSSGALSYSTHEVGPAYLPFRNTPNDDLYYLLSATLLQSPDPNHFFCRHYAPGAEECESLLFINDNLTGGLKMTVNEKTQTLPLVMTLNDNHLRFQVVDGFTFHFLPASDFTGVHIEETGETFSE